MNTKRTSAFCIDFDDEGPDSPAGFSVREHFLLENPDFENNPSKGEKEDLELEFTLIGRETEWRVSRDIFNIWCVGLPVGDTFSRKEFSSFDEVIEYLTTDEMPAFDDFIDYVIGCLEEHSQWHPDCKTLLKELIVHKDAKQVEDEQHG